MAYRGEQAAALGGGMMGDVQASVETKPQVSPADLKRVRIALAAMTILAAIDFVLYMPRFF